MSDPGVEPTVSRRCPRCGRSLSADAPEGLCAACLFSAGLESQTRAGGLDATRLAGAGAEAKTMAHGAAPPVGRGRPASLEPGQTFGAYRIGRPLGTGGMGEVYEAEHLESGRRLAIKLLRGQLGHAEDRARFLREGQLAASISHPHTVYIYGSEEIDGVPVITMELLPGGTLADRVAAGGPLPPAEAVSAILDIIGGLDAAQAAGILHRDIKPSNCFTDALGAVKVGDFGLSISTLARDVVLGEAVTGFQGTPQYAAPEQLRGEPLDVRADMYAVGATLYFLLTGEPPFTAPDLRELVARVTSEPPPSPRAKRRDIPVVLAGIVTRCLSKAPGDRPASYAALADALRPFATSTAAPARPGLRLVAGLVDMLLIAAPFSLLSAAQLTPASGGFRTTVNPIALWVYLVGFVYYMALEGIWSASLGKRLFGLRVVSTTGVAPPLQILRRTLLFYAPALPTSLTVLIVGVEPLTAALNARPALGVAFTLSNIALTALLFVSVRRRNGFAGLHDLASGTRVVSRASSRLRTGAARQTEDRPAPRSAAWMRCGPFDVIRELQPAGGGLLMEGIDPVLRRRVWIHLLPSGAPPQPAWRRDVARSGRLRWLAGRRANQENWDAFEAPEGRALLDHPPNSVPWADAKTWLVDLATEIAASDRDGGMPVLALDRVWIRPDGRAMLLDFPWPGAGARSSPAESSPARFMAGVANYVVVGLGRARPAATSPAVPLSAARLLATWMTPAAGTTGPEEVRRALLAATSALDRVPPLRRAVPMGLAALPAVLALGGTAAMLPAYRASTSPERFTMIRLLATVTASDTGAAGGARDADHRRHIETYLAGKHRRELTDEAVWGSAIVQSQIARFRPAATRIAAARPVPSAEDLAAAEAALATDLAGYAVAYDRSRPQLARSEHVIAALLLALAGAFACGLSVASTLIAPGGLITRALGLAVVDRQGREAGRLRALVRVLVAWSPVIALFVWGARDPVNRMLNLPVSPLLVVGSVMGLIAAGAVWTLLRPSRGPHDAICGTQVVPR